MGNDYTVTLAAHSGQLQLNAYEPIEGLAVMESQHLLFTTSQTLRTQCIDGITVNEKVLAHYMETTIGIVTALNPVLGYEKATELAAEAHKSGKGFEVIQSSPPRTDRRNPDPVVDQTRQEHLSKKKIAEKKIDSHRGIRRSGAAFIGAVAALVRVRWPSRGAEANATILATGGTIAGAAATAAVRL
jgi:aspartate ammonia-lyase